MDQNDPGERDGGQTEQRRRWFLGGLFALTAVYLILLALFSALYEWRDIEWIIYLMSASVLLGSAAAVSLSRDHKLLRRGAQTGALICMSWIVLIGLDLAGNWTEYDGFDRGSGATFLVVAAMASIGSFRYLGRTHA